MKFIKKIAPAKLETAGDSTADGTATNGIQAKAGTRAPRSGGCIPVSG